MKKIVLLTFIFLLLFNQFVFADSNKLLTTIEDSIYKLVEERSNLLTSKDSANKVPVILYHHVLKEDDINKYNRKNNATISLENFERQMKYLHDNGYNTITNYELEEFIKGKINLPKKSVVIHFDDGYLSNTHYAYPILKKYNMKATIFIMGATEKIPYQNFHPKHLQFINFEDMDDFSDVFSFESHTYDLHRLVDGKVRLSIVDKNTLREDLLQNKKLLGAKRLAYPRGKNNPSIIEEVKSTGHTSAFTVEEQYVKRGTDIYKIPRFSIFPSTSMDDFKKIVRS